VSVPCCAKFGFKETSEASTCAKKMEKEIAIQHFRGEIVIFMWFL
jgi:hypothetical protein